MQSSDRSAMSVIGRRRGAPVRRLLAPAVLAASLTLAACGSSTDAQPVDQGTSAPVSVGSSEQSSTEQSESTESTESRESTESTETTETTESTESTESTETTETTETTESTETTETTESTETSEETTGSTSAGKDGTLTKPGTKLKIGASAIVEYQTGTKSDSYYQHGTLKVSITKIVKGDPKIFDKLKNKADFKDLIPYYVYATNEIVSYQGKVDGNAPNPAIVYGVTRDGRLAGKAIGLGSGSLGACDSELFGGTDIGLKATKCTVALVKKDGEPVVGAAFSGDDDVYPSSSDNPYDDSPVLWLP